MNVLQNIKYLKVYVYWEVKIGKIKIGVILEMGSLVDNKGEKNVNIYDIMSWSFNKRLWLYLWSS